MAHSFCLWLALAAPVPALSPEALRKEQEAAWTDLGKQNVDAIRAVLQLSKRPEESVSFLKTKMKPLILDATAVKRGLIDLESDNEKVWKPAFENFQYFDPRLAMSIPDLFDTAKEGRARERIMAVISGQTHDHFSDKPLTLTSNAENVFQIRINNRGWSVRSDIKSICPMEWYRVIHALVFFEHVGSPPAIEILQKMATGHSEAWPTIRAKEALARLDRK